MNAHMFQLVNNLLSKSEPEKVKQINPKTKQNLFHTLASCSSISDHWTQIIAEKLASFGVDMKALDKGN